MSTKKRLVLESISIDTHRIDIVYRYGEQAINRGLSFSDEFDLTAFENDQQFVKLVRYCALMNSVYLFDLEYFEEIEVPFALQKEEIQFFEKTFLHGLGEFRYVNNIPIKLGVRVIAKPPAETSELSRVSNDVRADSAIVLNGGGKDGAVGMNIALQVGLDVSWFSVNDNPSRQRIRQISKVPRSFIVQKITDDYVKENKTLSGHKPMSSCVAFAALLTAYLSHTRYIIVSNEYSANFGNLSVDGFEVNHQYSKSAAFEVDIQQLLINGGYQQRYFSIIRPLYELQVLKIFSTLNEYHQAFISCNAGIKEDVWCRQCSKCAFVIAGFYLVAPGAAEKVWGSANDVLNEEKLQEQIIELINPHLKPFECTGTLEENRYIVEQLLASSLLMVTNDVLLRRLETYLVSRPEGSFDMQGFDAGRAHFPAEVASSIEQTIEHLLEK